MTSARKTPAPDSAGRDRDAAADYVFPERILLDEQSAAEFEAELAHPREPSDALRALFRE